MRTWNLAMECGLDLANHSVRARRYDSIMIVSSDLALKRFLIANEVRFTNILMKFIIFLTAIAFTLEDTRFIDFKAIDEDTFGKTLIDTL